MLQQQALIIIKILMFFDTLCIVAAGYIAYYSLLYAFPSLPLVNEKPFLLSIIVIIVANNYTFNEFGLYSPIRFRHFSRAWWQILKAVCVDFIFLASIIFFLRDKTYSRIFFLYFGAFTFLLLAAQRYLFSIYTESKSRNGFNRRKILIVGQDDRARAISEALERQLSYGHELLCELPEKMREAVQRAAWAGTRIAASTG